MAISKVILNGETLMDVTSDTAEAGKMLSGIKATKNDGTKVTGNIATKSSTDLTASGATVTAPAGYYASNASKSVTTMTLPTSASSSATSGYSSKATLARSTSDRYINIPPGYNPSGGYYKINKVANGSVTAPSSISGTSATVSTGTNTLTLTKSVSVTPSVTTAGYISSGTAGNSSVSLTASVTTKGAATITPSTSEQSIAAGTYLTGKQTIAAMPSGTAGTPKATKGTVSNHSVSVTPSVTNTTGYITGGTKTGTAVTVSASELVSGTKSITENGTGVDVTNYASVDVNVSSGASNIAVGSFTTSSTSGTTQTVTVPYTGSGYPVMIRIEVDNGVGDWMSNSLNKNIIGQLVLSKVDWSTPMTYSYHDYWMASAWITSSSGDILMQNQKNAYMMPSGPSSPMYSSDVIFVSSATQFIVGVRNDGSKYGLNPSSVYHYVIVYSS